MTNGLSCDASTVAVANSTTGRQATSTYYQEGFKASLVVLMVQL